MDRSMKKYIITDKAFYSEALMMSKVSGRSPLTCRPLPQCFSRTTTDSCSHCAQDRSMKKYIITDKAFYSEALMIVLPVVLQAIINQGVNMMDTIMVGKLGEAAISSVVMRRYPAPAAITS